MFSEDKNRIKRQKGREIDFEEIFLDKSVKEKEEKEGFSEKRLEVPLKKINFFSLLVLGLILFGILFFSAFKIQIVEGENYKKFAHQNKFIKYYLDSERGVIYDRNMNQLVWNEVSFDLVLKKSDLPENREEVFQKVGEIIGKNSQEITERAQFDSSEEITVEKDLSHRALVLLEAKKEGLPGFSVKKSILRNYQTEGSLSHVLGYLGKISPDEIERFESYQFGDWIGKTGVEKSYESVLGENKGEMEVERSASGEIISQQVVSLPQSGDSLVLSLDFSLQKKAEESLKNIIEEVGSTGGAFVALNPQNGQILSLVSLPSFDNNLFARGISEKEFQKLNEDPKNPQLNRAIGGVYLTGSTIKPLIGTAALEEGVIKESTQLYCPLDLCLENIYSGEPECYGDWSFHGWTDIKRAIAESVNPFFYMVGGGYTAPSRTSSVYDERLPRKLEGLGVTKISEYLQLFGLAQKTGIELSGEVQGRVPTPNWKEEYFSGYPRENQLWYLGDTYNLSIGQGYLLATPVQIASAFQAIANGGVIFEPKVGLKVLTNSGDLKEEVKSKIKRKDFISSESLSIIKEGMCQAVSSGAGSAHSLSSLSVGACAKTGTAQISGTQEIYHNWITVFAPRENPEILLTVLIEKVEGTRVAAQKVALDVLNWYFTH